MDVGNRTNPCVFSHQVAGGVDVGNLVCLRAFALKPVLQCKVEFRGADRSGMAASFMCMFAALFDIVLVGFARQ